MLRKHFIIFFTVFILNDFFAFGINAQYLIYNHVAKNVCLYQNNNIIKTFTASQENTSNIQFSGSNKDVVYYVENNNGISRIIEDNFKSDITQTIYLSKEHISYFYLYKDELYVITNTENNNDHKLVLVNRLTKAERDLYKATGEHVILSNPVVCEKYICFMSYDFGKSNLLIINKDTSIILEYKKPIANIFANINNNKLLIETMKLNSNNYISDEQYDGSLLLLDLDTQKCIDLKLKYERMGSKPILLDNNCILLPIEYNKIINQLKSFPFGIRTKDIKYQFYNITSNKMVFEYLYTNTDEKEILDVKLF